MHIIFNYIHLSSSVRPRCKIPLCHHSPRFLSELSDKKAASEDGFRFSLTYTLDGNLSQLAKSMVVGDAK